jgi:hypothetical protein
MIEHCSFGRGMSAVLLSSQTCFFVLSIFTFKEIFFTIQDRVYFLVYKWKCLWTVTTRLWKVPPSIKGCLNFIYLKNSNIAFFQFQTNLDEDNVVVYLHAKFQLVILCNWGCAKMTNKQDTYNTSKRWKITKAQKPIRFFIFEQFARSWFYLARFVKVMS